MAIQILKTSKNKENQFMVIFRGGGKLVWYPSKREIETLLYFLLKDTKDNPIIEQE